MSKLSAERNQKILLELVAQPGNDICADCRARNPRWASHNLGVFICVNCASIHRKIGTHISQVKSLTMDAWKKEQVETMQQKGNIKSNMFYNPKDMRPTNMIESERDSELEKHIRDKYQHKRFIDKSAFVVSQLGPSRSASTIRSASATSAKPQVSPKTSSVPSALPSLPPPAPTSSFTTASMNQVPNTMSQPNPPQPAAQASTSNPVFADLMSLQAQSSQPSLPLQYQSQPPVMATQNPAFMPAGSPNPQFTNGATGYQSPFAATPQMPNMYQQQQQPTGYASPLVNNTGFSAGGGYNMGMGMQLQAQPTYGQQFTASPQFGGGMQPSSSPAPQFFQPQPQMQAYNQTVPYQTTPSPYAMGTPSPYMQQAPQQQPSYTMNPMQPQQQQANQYTSWMNGAGQGQWGGM